MEEDEKDSIGITEKIVAWKNRVLAKSKESMASTLTPWIRKISWVGIVISVWGAVFGRDIDVLSELLEHMGDLSLPFNKQKDAVHFYQQAIDLLQTRENADDREKIVKLTRKIDTSNENLNIDEIDNICGVIQIKIASYLQIEDDNKDKTEREKRVYAAILDWKSKQLQMVHHYIHTNQMYDRAFSHLLPVRLCWSGIFGDYDSHFVQLHMYHSLLSMRLEPPVIENPSLAPPSIPRRPIVDLIRAIALLERLSNEGRPMDKTLILLGDITRQASRMPGIHPHFKITMCTRAINLANKMGHGNNNSQVYSLIKRRSYLCYRHQRETADCLVSNEQAEDYSTAYLAFTDVFEYRYPGLDVTNNTILHLEEQVSEGDIRISRDNNLGGVYYPGYSFLYLGMCLRYNKDYAQADIYYFRYLKWILNTYKDYFVDVLHLVRLYRIDGLFVHADDGTVSDLPMIEGEPVESVANSRNIRENEWKQIKFNLKIINSCEDENLVTLDDLLNFEARKALPFLAEQLLQKGCVGLLAQRQRYINPPPTQTMEAKRSRLKSSPILILPSFVLDQIVGCLYSFNEPYKYLNAPLFAIKTKEPGA